MNKIRIFLAIVIASALCAAGGAEALPEYAERTNQGCMACHKSEEGGELIEEGLVFAASGYVWPPEGGYRVISPLPGPAKALTGFLHFVAGFMWFGTILYVHIVLRPAYAAKGLPRSEVRIGLISMIVAGLTGVVLTLAKVRGFEVLTGTHWGQVLSVKIALYAYMVFSALFVAFFIGPRLRSAPSHSRVPADGVYDPRTLAAFDGKDGKPMLIAHEGAVYDVSASPLWSKGEHFRHKPGGDHTESIVRAPHGPEKLEKVKKVGTYDPSRIPPKTPTQKLFFAIAYTNLAMVFVVLLTVAYWRWGM